jgi:putative flippase GtrA
MPQAHRPQGGPAGTGQELRPGRLVVSAFEVAVERPVAGPSRAASGIMRQFLRFSAVGASGVGVNMAAFALLNLAAPYAVAFAGAFVTAASTNFLLNRVWTFRGQATPARVQYLRFLLVSAFVLGFDLLVLAALVEHAGAPEMVAALLTIAVATPISFLGNRFWSFADVAPGQAVGQTAVRGLGSTARAD